MDYSKKENYITVQPDPNLWRKHANYKIMCHYSKYIKGVCGDLGANHGACTLLMLDFKENIEQIYGLDMNYEALKIAYDNASRLNPSIPVNFMATNLLSVPLGDSKFNFLMSFHTLEHIYPVDAPKFVSEIFRMLAPGAKFLISIPYERAYPDPAHVAFYNVESVCALFEDAGFETIECLKDNRWSEKNLLTGLFEKPLK